MQLEEMRMNKKMGESDRTLERQLEDAKKHLQAKYDGLMQELNVCMERVGRAGGPRRTRAKPFWTRTAWRCATRWWMC